jgi:sortase A
MIIRRKTKLKSNRFKGKMIYIFLFILGMLVFFYPTFTNIYYDYIKMRRPIDDNYKEVSENINITVSDKEFHQIESDPLMKPLLSKDLEYIRAYNQKLLNTVGDTTDPFGEDDGRYVELETDEGNGDSIFAYITIDKINATLPIYLGATDENLNKGVAVINGTSIPVGGKNTNSVIAGHTGRIQKFFTDLPQLKPGDEIKIENPWEILHYKVIGNKLILPNQEEYLSVVSGEDIITLLTCYHGTTKNDRLLVFAKRYYPDENSENKREYNEEVDLYSYISEVELKAKSWYEKPQILVIGVVGLLSCLFIFTFVNKR